MAKSLVSCFFDSRCKAKPGCSPPGYPHPQPIALSSPLKSCSVQVPTVANKAAHRNRAVDRRSLDDHCDKLAADCWSSEALLLVDRRRSSLSRPERTSTFLELS